MLKTMKRRRARSARTTKRARTGYKTTKWAPVVSTRYNVTPRTGLGNGAWCKMMYSRKFQMGAGLTGTATVTQFRTNSINEVLIGIPSQPTCHDQLQPLFEKYCVVSMKYRIVGFNSSTTNAGVICVQVTDSSTTTTLITEAIYQGQTDWKIVAPNTGGPAVVEFDGYINNPNVMGVTRENYLNSTQFTPVFGSNPSDVGFLNLYVADSASGTAPTINFTIFFEFNVYLLGGNYVPAS